MFTRLADLVIGMPKLVLALSLAVLIAGIGAMAFVTPDFSSNFEFGDSVESTQVHRILRDEYGISENSIIMIFDGVTPFSDEASQQTVESIISPLRDNPQFSAVISPLSTGDPTLISTDGSSAMAVAVYRTDVEPTSEEVDAVVENVRQAAERDGLTVSFTGNQVVGNEVNTRVGEGLLLAEMVSIPITLVVLVLVFGSLVAAGMPLIAGLASIGTAIAAAAVLSTMSFQSVFAANIITMLGLGLGIDYSLFLVKRYREELAVRSQPEALRVAMRTVGKAIFFSGITVILGLGGTQFFDMPVLRSLGQAGIIVTACAMFFGLTLLPATLQLLGPRINRWHIGRQHGVNEQGESAFWARVARTVMARPGIILAGTLAVLLVLAMPLLNMRLTPGGPEMLPVESASRQATERLTIDFPRATADPLYVIVHSTESDAVERIQAQISGMDGVNGIRAVPGSTTTLLQVVSGLPTSESDGIVHEIRDLSTSQVKIQVGGAAAVSVDTGEVIGAGILPAVLFVGISAYIVLLLTFGSVLLPLKAMFMSGMSIAASLGLVVWVFQDGHLEGVLNFSAPGNIIAMVPILVACVLFGLSMDYEVLLLSRIQEEWEHSGDNRHAIETGLAHTGMVVTGAATIMVVVFAGFILADVLVIKSMGFGLAVAVLLDATVVRGVLVPSAMRLMGKWNWWAPAPLQSFTRKLGLSHSNGGQAPTAPLTPANSMQAD